MRIFKLLMIVLLVLCSLFFVGGFFISDQWMVSRTIMIQASPERIYPLISNFKAWEKWSLWNASQDATFQYTYEGTEGVGAKRSWTSKDSNGWMQFTAASPETGVAYDVYIEMGRSHSVLHGDIILLSKGQATQVTWVDRGDSGKSYVKRWMSLLIQPMIERNLEKGLTALKHAAEER